MVNIIKIMKKREKIIRKTTKIDLNELNELDNNMAEISETYRINRLESFKSASKIMIK
jgi:hypothetical protein